LIGLSITTRNRPEVFKYTLNQFRLHWADKFRLIVVNDSDPDFVDKYNKIVTNSGVTLTHIVNAERKGIPYSKNLAYQQLKDCDYQIWFDDDCCPKIQGWDKYIIDASEADDVHHYLYIHKWAHIKYKEDYKKYTQIYSHGTACMMFFTRQCYEFIEGFSEPYGYYGWWHGDLSHTLYNAGLSPAYYCSIKGITKYIKAYDLDGPPSELHGKFSSCMSKKDRMKSIKEFRAIHKERRQRFK
jgi:hypothetical protein